MFLPLSALGTTHLFTIIYFVHAVKLAYPLAYARIIFYFILADVRDLARFLLSVRFRLFDHAKRPLRRLDRAFFLLVRLPRMPIAAEIIFASFMTNSIR